MNQNILINKKEDFQKKAGKFLTQLFESTLISSQGEIEIRAFGSGAPCSTFYNLPSELLNDAYRLCNDGWNVYLGVNPRVGRGGKKENIHHLVTFHVDIDCGKDGHKKGSDYESSDHAMEAINNFPLKPTMVINSGGGFHCYWVLKEPVKVNDDNISILESINKSLSKKIGGDVGTHDLPRILRLPGTYNFKLKDNPREVKSIYLDGPKYDYDQFSEFIDVEKKPEEKSAQKPVVDQKTKNKIVQSGQPAMIPQSLDKLPISDKIKHLILNGNDGTYASRSEVDMAVILTLVNKGLDFYSIRNIYDSYPIGEKYREHGAPDEYLRHNIVKAKNYSNLTEAEMQDPLFINEAIIKTDKEYQIDIVKFQECFMNKRHIKYLGDAGRFFEYNGNCYINVNDNQLNHFCQKELGTHRNLFNKAMFQQFIHFAIGSDYVDSEKISRDQMRYLTLKNGLFDLEKSELVAHTPDIFTTNLLPYAYNIEADCPHFKQYLKEIFNEDDDKIKFVQESVGYAFQKSIPKPAIFIFVGGGSNGKSVLLDTIMNLFGEENSTSMSLGLLTKPNYVLELFGKMANISSETPQNKILDTDVIKAVVAGDWVSGKRLYENPTQFKPYAKHYISMNQVPNIEDSSNGMSRRLYFVDFSRSFSEDEMDVNLTETFKTELSGIFNWAYEGYKRLKESKFQFTKVESMKESKIKYLNQSNSVSAFAFEYLKKEDGKNVKFSEVYERYQVFCDSEGFNDKQKKAAFRKMLESSGYTIDNNKKMANQVYMFDVVLLPKST